MSVRHQRATGAIFEQILVMIIALLMPLLISFVIYLIGSSIGAGTPPTVGYGITCLPNSPSGVCNIVQTGSNSYLSFPSIAVSAINALMDVVAFLVAIIEGIRIAPKLMESRED